MTRLKSDEAQAAKPRPHILFVMAGECKASVVSRQALRSKSNELRPTDDLGHGDLGHFNNITHTPAIGALIADGVTLSAYCKIVMLSRFCRASVSLTLESITLADTFKICSPSRKMPQYRCRLGRILLKTAASC